MSSEELLCPDCGSSMTVLVSSPGKQDKPVFTVGLVNRFVGEHVGAANLNSSSIKTLNGNMSVTALVDISTSSSSSSYLEAVGQTQESEMTDSAELSNENILPASDKQYVLSFFLKLINNSSSINKGKHDRDGFWMSDLNSITFYDFYFSVFSLVLVSVEKIYQTLKTVFDHISKHLEVRQKYSAVRRIFNSPPGV